MFWAPSPLSLTIPFASEKGDDAQDLPSLVRSADPMTLCPAQIAPEWGRVGAADLAGASSAAWAVWHALSKKRRFFIPAEGFFGKIFAFGDQFRRLAARLFGSELRAPSSERDASEISPTRFSRGRWWMRLPTRRCPSQTSSFGSMRTSTSCGGTGRPING